LIRPEPCIFPFTDAPNAVDLKKFLSPRKLVKMGLINGVLSFRTTLFYKEFLDGRYRTCFGPRFMHSGKIYCVCNPCLARAFTRLMLRRKPELPGLHDQLLANQVTFFTRTHAVFTHLKHMIAGLDDEIVTMVELARVKCHDPHPKKLQRENADRNLNYYGYGEDHWVTRHKKVMEAFMKPDEWAKPGKFPRLVFNLGVEASLQGGFLLEIAKTRMCGEDIPFAGGHIRLVKKVTYDEILYCFDQMINLRGRFFYCIFSDDACCSYFQNGQTHYCNIDISGCDASHGEGIFSFLANFFEPRAQEFFNPLLDQCQFPIVVRSVHDRYEKKTIQLRRHILPSGSTLTTFLNNIGSLAIAIAFIENDFDPEASKLAGYIITIDRYTEWFRLQFLKHSPVLDVLGNLRALANLGIPFRASGICKGDLPGHGDLLTRARTFQAGLLHGIYPRTTIPIIEHMLHNAGGRPSTPPNTDEYLTFTRSPVFTITDQAWAQRYDITNAELADLHAQLRPMTWDVVCISCEASRKILKLDYGL